MDPQIEKFLGEYADKALKGPGFIAFAPKEKEEFKTKLLDYYSELIFDTLLRSLNDAQVAEIQTLPDLGSPEAQDKLIKLSASIPGFIFILQERFEKVTEEISRTGKIPDATAPKTSL